VGQPVGAGMVRVLAGGGAVQGGDGGSCVGGRGGVHWHGRRRPRALALAWEAAAREGQQRERAGLDWVSL